MWYIATAFSFVLILCSVYYSRRLINSVTVTLGPIIILDWIGNIFYEQIFARYFTDQGLAVALIIIGSFYSAFTLAYCRSQSDPPNRLFRAIERMPDPNHMRLRVYIPLATGLALIAVNYIAWKSGGSLFSRELYEITRTGYGPLFFGAQFLCLTNVSLSVYYLRKIETLVGILVNIGIISALGAKGPIVVAMILCVVPFSVRRVTSVRQVLFVACCAMLVGLVAIASFYFYTNWAQDDMILGAVSYIDSTRNFASLVDRWPRFELGRLWFEDNVYMVVPRFLVPGKPAIWGSGVISDEMFRLIVIDRGAPSFTRFGRVWADFGFVSMLISPIMGYIYGKFAAQAENSLMRKRTLLATTIFLAGIDQAYLNPGGLVLVIVAANVAMVFGVLVLVRGPKRDWSPPMNAAYPRPKPL